ncbi:hypothetical protein XI09_40920 [Bradyrhizobium sp. CCBAU 11386]|uniref:hypothetical protein n=1 Tax=Bradyrhizobium sp. CCBAU 11386 TaxID=1630837 RepID=UPI002302F115|nr:hypothetical protein [Bradyrhizobium sp. CCBAU 11386]MDA9510913.1 hypothetical protein [Bradyrhizobium sp. CCBAU 11386]
MTKRTKVAAAARGKKHPTTPTTTTSTAPTRSFEQAKSEWLPLHVAMMRFFPTYATEKAFPNDVKQMVATLTGPDDFSVAEIAPYVVRIACDRVGLVIDAEHGEIEIERDVVGDDWEVIFDFASIRARMDQFPAEFPAVEVRPEFREATRRQHDLALRLIGLFATRFREAVDDGGAELFGRWRDLKAPFEPVYPDQWHRLKKAPGVDWSPGTDMSTTTAAGDVTIYSVQVHPHRKQESASNLASIACTEFFVGEIRKRSLSGRVIQSELINDARERWPRNRLPEREILRCFAKAKSETNSTGLVRRGRPPKLIHSTQ